MQQHVENACVNWLCVNVRNAGTFQSNETERLKSEKRCFIRSKMSLNFGANPIKYIFCL